MDEIKNYINNQPAEIIPILERVRSIILENAPNVTESIAYGMPAYKLNSKPLVYFGAQKKHLGFYATPTGHEKFTTELSCYKQGKGSVQFPYNKPIPYELIANIVKFRVYELTNQE